MALLVTDYLDKAVKRFPNKIGFVDDTKSITFTELQTLSYHIAYKLIVKKYFKNPIAVFMDKSVECITTFIGIAYSGNFYVPIDVNMPYERISKIINILQPSAIISDNGSLKRIEPVIRSNCGIDILMYSDMFGENFEEIKIKQRIKSIIDTDVLYVLFTSGSTGEPKGVVVSHKSVISYTEWASKAFSLDQNVVLGNQTPFYFSMSVFDIYQTLKNAATMYIIPKMLFSFPIRLIEFLNKNNINLLYWVPSALCIVANSGVLDKRDTSNIRRILFAGEVMPTKQLNIWRKHLPKAFFANLFGPTEVTDICCYYILERVFADNEILPIGNACENAEILILDENNQLVKSKDVIGELCVRGSILACGYYNNPEKTNAVFIQNPLNKKYPEYIYRTGDLVHFNKKNELIYDGRKDFQIKHMGYRIELGEIEAVISSIDEIEMCCCLYTKKANSSVLFRKCVRRQTC